MTFLPIVERELRVAARRRSTYRNRLVTAVIALAFFSWPSIAHWDVGPQEIGQFLFTATAVIIFIFATVAGVWATADCLSEEKREGTLGLLFLTDLKGYDVVLGKLAATSLNALYGMLAVIPVLAIPLLLGGVSAGEFWRVVLVALNLLFLSLTAGLFVSSFCRDDRKASGGTLGMIILALGLIPMFGVYIASKTNNFPIEFLIPSPAFACWTAFDVFFTSMPNFFWTTTALTQVYAWALFLLACSISRRTWQDRPAGKKLSSWKQRWQSITEGSPEKRAALRRMLLEKNAFLWLAGRGRFKKFLVWVFLASCAAMWIWICRETDDTRWWDNPISYITAIILSVGLKAWLASEASRRLSEDRRSSALELILSTPLSIEEILRGQRMALIRQFAAPVAMVLIVDFIFMTAGVTHSHGQDAVLCACYYLVCMIFLVADLEALSWVGMWLGLISKKNNRAAGGAIARIIILPGFIFGLGMTFFGWFGFVIMTSSGFGKLMDQPVALFVLWSVLCVVNNSVWSLQAKQNLRTRFREIATQRGEIRKRDLRAAKPSPPVLAVG